VPPKKNTDVPPNDEPKFPQPPPYKSEQLLIERPAPDFDRALVISPGRAQLAPHLAQVVPQGTIDVWFFDLFAARVAQTGFEHGLDRDRLDVLCSPDLPDHSYQFIAIPVLSRGEAELTRDLLQQAHQRLEVGGTLATAVDNENDSWLMNQMKELFSSVNSFRSPVGAAYLGKKKGPLKRVRKFTCQFAFRDQERLIQLVSEPGVFSHRRFDAGARQLLNACEIDDGDRVLDLGCGSGGVALAAAFQTSSDVWAVDCNTRAIRCTELGAKLNRLTNVRTLLNADGKLNMNSQFELVLANPPYYSNHTISQRFVDTAWDCLVEGGALITVTKQGQWFERYYQHRDMDDIVSFASGDYTIVCGRKTW
jgi:16S rRNA (guanine1207-N2)-methyltransferase